MKIRRNIISALAAAGLMLSALSAQAVTVGFDGKITEAIPGISDPFGLNAGDMVAGTVDYDESLVDVGNPFFVLSSFNAMTFQIGSVVFTGLSLIDSLVFELGEFVGFGVTTIFSDSFNELLGLGGKGLLVQDLIGGTTLIGEWNLPVVNAPEAPGLAFSALGMLGLALTGLRRRRSTK